MKNRLTAALLLILIIFSSGIVMPLYASNYTQSEYASFLADPMTYPEPWANNLWGGPWPIREDYIAEGWPEAARLLIEYIQRNTSEGLNICSDGISIEGLNYHFLYLAGMLSNARPLIGYTDAQYGYTPPAGYAPITEPLTFEDLFPKSRRMEHMVYNAVLATLPNGMDPGTHDTSLRWKDFSDVTACMWRWGMGGNFYFHGYGSENRANSYLLGGFGQLGLGSAGRHNDPYLQTQARLHFSPKSSYHPTKPGMGHAANDTLMFGLYGRGRNLISFPGHQGQNHQVRNKNTVIINNKNQSEYLSDLSGRLEVMSAMAGLQVGRVDASHIKHNDGAGTTGLVPMNTFRRTLLSNTVDAEKTYVLDVFEVDGGNIHTYNLAGCVMYGQEDPITSLNVASGSLPFSGIHWDDCSNNKVGSYGSNDTFWVDFRCQDNPKLGTRSHIPAQGEAGELHLHRLTEPHTIPDALDAIGSNEARLGITFNPGRPELSLHRDAGPGTQKSTFVLVHEVKDGVNDSFISSVTRTPLSNNSFAIEVQLTNGRKDTYLISLSGRQVMTHAGFRADAEIAATSVLGTESDLWMIDGAWANNGFRAITSSNQQATGTLTLINRLEDGDGSDSIETSLYLEPGYALCGQTILVEHSDAGTLKFVNGFTIEKVEAIPSGSRIFVRTDPGIALAGGATEELFFPWRTGSSALVRFIPSTTSIPYMARMTPDPEPWKATHPKKGIALSPGDSVNWVTVPDRSPVDYELVNTGVAGIARESLALKSHAKVLFQVQNPGGLTPTEEIMSQFWVEQPALKASPGALGLKLDAYYGENYTFTESVSPRPPALYINALNWDEVDYAVVKRDHGAFITGYLDIPVSGLYRFYSRADTSAQLSIGGEAIISQSGMRCLANWSAEIYLEQGLHELEYHYYNARLGYMQVRWEGPGINYGPIPDDRFYRDVVPDANAAYELRYTASIGGSISGTSTQPVSSGADGSAVGAVVADAAYQFIGWSDGVLTAQRQDTNIQQNLTVEALFEKMAITVTYATDGNGVLAGPAVQSIAPGAETVEIEAFADKLYRFDRWSDGNSSAKRSDIAPSSDQTLTALFIPSNANTFHITYNGNGQNSGTPPDDALDYYLHDQVSVMENTGFLFKTNYLFSGWNTQADGLGMDFAPGDQFSITENLSLFAQWRTVQDAEAYYTFDDSQNPYRDDSGNGHHGTADGSPAWVSSGKLSGSIDLDGATDRITCGTFSGAPALTVAFWMKADKLAYMIPAYQMPNDSSGKGWAVKLRNNGDIWWRIGSHSSYSDLQVGNVYATSTWAHLVFTFEEGTARVYLNGTKVGEKNGITKGVDSISAPLTLGIPDSGVTYEKFEGELDDFRLYHRVLSETEIQDVYAYDPSIKYAVSYYANGSDGGIAPVDNNTYAPGARATVLANSGNLTRTDHTFTGWNTQPDGAGSDYVSSDTFTMPSNDAYLYARWVAMPVDSDQDGLTDALEIALGTDPNDPDSGFGIDGALLPIPGKIEITWPSATGVLYRIWESPDLAGWAVVRDWAAALTPPEDVLEFDLTPSNGFFKVEAEIQ